MAPRKSRYVDSGGNGSGGGKDLPGVAFAKRLNKALLAKGWKQSEFTLACQNVAPVGVSFGRHLPSSWLTGKHMPSRVYADIAARALGIPIADLIPDADAVMTDTPQKSGTISFTTSGKARVKLDIELDTEVAIKIMTLAHGGGLPS